MFLQAGSPAELRAYMAQYPDSRCIAGGTDIMPVQNRENDREAVFIDISGAAALHRIVAEDGVLSVGAAATFAEIERNALLRQYAPALCLAAAQVGSPQIRNLGTIGGNVAHGSPAADTLPVLAMLDAEVRLYSATEGTCRDIPVDTFITGPGQTLLRPGEYRRCAFPRRRRAGAWPMKKWDGAMRWPSPGSAPAARPDGRDSA